MAAGDFSQHIEVQSQDEIGVLGQTFNTMADEINKLIVGLEARTKDIQTVVDVSNQISTILDVNRLLQDVVDLTKERFALYHAHIYIMNEEEQELTLTAGAGHVGRQMVAEHRTIDINNKGSVVAGAARNRRGSIVNDVTASPNFLPHPLLPNTKSELAVPLIARGRVLGVLDVQGDQVGLFTDEALGVLEILASQIATALSNAALFEVAERTSRHEQALSTIDRQIQQATDVDEMLQIVVRELGKALRVQHTAIELSLASNSSNGSNEHAKEASDV
jgi:GAF domain-containing protein